MSGGSSAGWAEGSDFVNTGSNPNPLAKNNDSDFVSYTDHSAMSSKVPSVKPASCFGVRQKTELGVPAAAQIMSNCFK